MIVLDTHALLWLAAGDEKLGKTAIQTIDDANHEKQLAVSAITFWEIALLQQKGRIEFTQDVSLWRRELQRKGLQEIPISGEIALHSTSLISFHADPADRFIVSTSILNQADLITADGKILNWDGGLKRIDARI